jgi:hypothetical protein
MLFTKPANLNGAELKAELKAVGVEVERITIEADGQLNIEIISGDEKKSQAVISAHNGSLIAPELTLSDKLASVGLSLEELKTALQV